MKTISPNDVHRVMRSILPTKNDDYPSDYNNETDESLHFGIKTEEQFAALLSKHKEKLIEIDQSPLDEADRQMFIEDYGLEYVLKREEIGYWFSYPALLRISLELEFGEEYESYSNIRDNITK